MQIGGYGTSESFKIINIYRIRWRGGSYFKTRSKMSDIERVVNIDR